MLFDDPATDEKAREAFRTLTDCTRNDDEFYLLIAVIRMFHEVKAEYREKARREAEKEKVQNDLMQAALYLVKK